MLSSEAMKWLHGNLCTKFSADRSFGKQHTMSQCPQTSHFPELLHNNKYDSCLWP